MTDSVVVEGYARLKDGKKWKTRWIVFRKPSPVADCLLLLVFKDKADKSEERASVTLEEICGLESGGRRGEGEGEGEGAAPFTLAVVCLSQTTVLAFHSEETLAAWELRLRYSLGEVHRFSVGVMAGTKLESGPATLHLCNNLLALARDTPPVVVGHWNLPDLRRYGPVPDGFVFEGGTRCGYWAGVFLLASPEGEQISFLFDCIVRGVSPTRGPRGLLLVPPDAGIHRSSFQERLNQETRELEKRLSVLSNRNSAGTRCSSVFVQTQASDGSANPPQTRLVRSVARVPGAARGRRPQPIRVLGKLRRGRLRPFGRLDPVGRRSAGRQSGGCGESRGRAGRRRPFGSGRPREASGERSPELFRQRHRHWTLVRDAATSAKDSDDPVTESLKGSSGGLLQTSARSQSGKSRATPSGDNPESGTTKSILTVCSVCGGVQVRPSFRHEPTRGRRPSNLKRSHHIFQEMTHQGLLSTQDSFRRGSPSILQVAPRHPPYQTKGPTAGRSGAKPIPLTRSWRVERRNQTRRGATKASTNRCSDAARENQKWKARVAFRRRGGVPSGKARRHLRQYSGQSHVQEAAQLHGGGAEGLCRPGGCVCAK
ncbi:uncharacterized protein LOC144065796 isoform X3 [Stigmatopora argus]